MDIRVVSEQTDIEACMAVRHAVFVGEQGVSEAEEADGLDGQCVHILARDGDTVIGAARLNYGSEDYVKIQRVCVAKAVRGRGVGADIIRHILGFLRHDGHRDLVRLGSQTHALDFYRKLGFTEFGDEYLDAGIPHRDMELRL